MRSVDFRIAGYFSWTIIFFGVMLAFAGLMVFQQHILLGSLLFIVSMTIFTTHHRLKIDLDKGFFHDYLWIWGLKNGPKGEFEKIEYLFIKKNNITQRMNNMVSSTTIRKEIYTAYLKFSETTKIELLKNSDKERLVSNLRKISKDLNIRIMDYSEGEPREIHD